MMWRELEEDCSLLRSARCVLTPRSDHTCRVLGIILLEAAVLSPPLPPAPTQNFWVARHKRGLDQTLGGAAMESWTIVPQILNIALEVASGALHAAGSFPSALSLVFHTLTDAARLR